MFLHQTLWANRAGTMFDVCERPFPPQAVVAYTILDSTFVSARKANWYICKLSLKHPKVCLTVNASGAKNGREIAAQGWKDVKQLHKFVD